METGEEATSLRAALCWSYQTLSRPAARMFRLLCTRPGPAVTANVAASLAGVPVPQAHRLLAELTRGNLVTEHPDGRFALHDLLRTYAADLADPLSDAERRVGNPPDAGSPPAHRR